MRRHLAAEINQQKERNPASPVITRMATEEDIMRLEEAIRRKATRVDQYTVEYKTNHRRYI